MQIIRYMNIFNKVTRVNVKNCFIYNNQIIFLVPKQYISKAIGKNAENIKEINKIIGKKIRVLAFPNNENEKEIISFVKDLIEPIELNKVEIKDGTLFIDSSRINKASLIGRNRLKEKELSKIIKDTFDIELKIG